MRGETAGMTTARSLTLSDAAEVCGTTKKALERRAERGTLTVGRRGGVRVVDVAELLRVGLLAAIVAGAAALYFAALTLSGLKLRQFVRK